jgi:enoyl-[acyl-carrier protein] reductase I
VAELGPKGIRVHAISPGLLATRAAPGIPEFDALLDKAKSNAPAHSLVSIDGVGVRHGHPRQTHPRNGSH